MTPIEWLTGRSLLVAEPVWSDYMDMNMDLYYFLEVTNPKEAKIFLIQRGFSFDDNWEDRIIPFIKKDVPNIEAPGWYTQNYSGFRVRLISDEQLDLLD